MSLKRFVLSLGALILYASVASPADKPHPASSPGDFQERCHSRGVVRCFSFDSPEEVQPHITPAADGRIHAVLDSSIQASGASSLRFDIMPRLGANSSGAFVLEFPQGFGSGEEFYVQWRQRFDQEMITRAYLHGEGWKQAILGADPARSCTANEVVLQNEYYRGFPQLYHSCGKKDSRYESLVPSAPSSDFLLQDAVGCRYSNQKAAQCFRYRPDQWMTFQVHVKIGRWYVNQSGNYHRDSTVELWVAEENKPSVLVISLPDYDLTNENPGQKFSVIWLLPYNTDKDPSEDHPVAHTWYDELIISKARIPDPGVATPNPPDSLSAGATGQGVVLAWRDNSQKETGFQIERCAGTIYECEASQAFTQVGVASARTTSFTDKTAARDKRYTWRVRATNKAGNSAYSNPVANVPRPPSDLVATETGTSVNLSWSDNSQDETEFVVESCSGADCSNFTATAHLPANQTQYTQNGLARGTTYRYRIRSANAAGSWVAWDKVGTAYSNIASVTTR